MIARGKTPPNNVGPRSSTPNYRSLAAQVASRSDGRQIFAGQREDAFYGDIGSIFDLVGFRQGTGNDRRREGLLRRLRGARDRAADPDRGAARQGKDRRGLGLDRSTEDDRGQETRARLEAGVRLGNPLVNEVVVPTPSRTLEPLGARERQAFAAPVFKPMLAELINDLYQRQRAGEESRRSRRRVPHRRQGPQLHRRLRSPTC